MASPWSDAVSERWSRGCSYPIGPSDPASAGGSAAGSPGGSAYLMGPSPSGPFGPSSGGQPGMRARNKPRKRRRIPAG